MEISLLLAQQILQLFLILLMGYAVVRCGLLKAADSRVLSVVMVYLALPCVVLKAFQIDDSPALRTGLLYAFAIAVLLHLLFLALTAVLKRPLQLDVIEGATLIYSNAAALVIPLVRALLGEEYVVYSCAFVIVQLILLWTHCSTSLQGGGAIEWKKILLNVNLISIVMGAVLFFAHIPLPGQLLGALNTMGDMVGPLGMLLAGMAIAESPLKQLFCTRRYYLPVALRLIGYPAAVLAVLRLLNAAAWVPDGRSILMTVYLAAITPACATLTSMAQLYHRNAAQSSALYVLSTLLSIVTMPVMIGLFALERRPFCVRRSICIQLDCGLVRAVAQGSFCRVPFARS